MIRSAHRWALLLVLGGCASTPPQYGSFLSETYADVTQRELAQSAVQGVQREHPGDAARWRFVHEAGDPFGAGLEHALREMGHEVAGSRTPKQAGEHELSYVVDQIKGTKLLLVVLHIDRVELARAYEVLPSGGVRPAGRWLRRQP